MARRYQGSLSTLNRVLSAQELHNRDVAHNMTILLGIASAQQLDGKALKEDLGIVKEQLARVETRLDGIEQQLATILALLKGGPQP
jgi:hypothetical protein